VKIWIEARLWGRCKAQPTKSLPYALHTHSAGIFVNNQKAENIMYGCL